MKTPVYFGYNDVDYKWVGRENWTYTKTFRFHASWRSRENIVLNLEGVDTVATVLLNDKVVGTTDNMFVRYRFDVKPYLKFYRKNKLVLEFNSPVNYASEQFERHKKNKYIVPPVCVPPSYHGECHVNFIRFVILFRLYASSSNHL